MNLSLFRTSVASELGLNGTAGSPDCVLIDRWLNMGVRDVLLRTHCFVASASTPLTAGQGDYTLDDEILAMLEISGPAGSGGFEPVTQEDMFELRNNNNGGGDVRAYTVLGSNLLLVYPTPSSAETLKIYFVPKPTEMAAPTDDPSTATYGGIPVEFHRGIELYAFARGGTFDDDESSEMGKSYFDQYEQFLARTIRPAVNRKASSRMARARIGGRPSYARRNDVYP